MRKILGVLGSAAVVSAWLAAPPAMAFHDGGVAKCNGCHTMHNSVDNPADNPTGNSYLLKESTVTDVCLRCHTNTANTWGGTDPLNPGNTYGGGQFIFLTEDNLNDGYKGNDPTKWIPGYQAGHSVISVDKAVGADPVNSTAPGGTYASNAMACSSCHDPHGKGGHFRLLYGNDFPESFSGGYPFDYTYPAPTAEGVSFSTPESNSNHTAYQAGMSQWCANCHGDYHNSDWSVLKHPSGMGLGSGQAAMYNLYEGTGHFTGDGTDAYLAAVPFEDAAMTTSYTANANPTSKVMCLSCHRSHATSAPNAGRWDFNTTIYSEEGVNSGAYPIPNPYAGTAGEHQRSLCNKCHGQDPVE